jgi:NifU-like protein
MSRKKFLTPFFWSSYSKKLISRIENPKFVGCFDPKEAEARQMRLVTGREGEAAEGHILEIHLLVDESDGIIADVRFQAFGCSALIGAAEAACDTLLRKNYDQAKRISTDLIDRQFRDKPDVEAFPPEMASYLNIVLSAIEKAADLCLGIPFVEAYSAPPLSFDLPQSGSYPGWKELPTQGKIAIIEEIIDREIRPYIELDAGGIQILNLVDDKELIIAYQGACTSCHSATGSTLNAIQQILQARIDPDIIVTPDLSFLT